MDSLDTVVEADEQPARFTKQVGAEPLAGYRLIEPLGRGSFGEVWKCEVPGGLVKAIKFVGGNLHGLDEHGSLATQEQAALQRIKAIRHPFLLSMERVEVIDGELIIVMELADRSLQDVLAECQAAGLAGVPREDLFPLLQEAAEALDLMNFQHGLQHLDVKPRNLFLVSNHVKVADFGLVNSLGEGDANHPRGGFTPLYSSPEVISGQVSRHSDQYSLAIVYQELLTGTLPFRGKNGRQLMLQHLTAEPDLQPVPAADRPWLARALSKNPEKRFSSCLDLVQALAYGREPEPSPAVPAGSSRMLRRPLLPWQGPADPNAPPPARVVGPPASTAVKVGPETLPGYGGDVRGTSTYPPVPSPSPSACDSIPGHRLLGCLSQNPLGDVWKVQAPDGRERLAHLLRGSVAWEAQADGRLLAGLKALRHPALPETQILRSASGRVVLVTDPHGRTLRDRLQECLADRLPGVPRTELLGYLASAAEALDELSRRHGLHHLALCPRYFLLEEDGCRLAQFGLISLVWLPGGEPAGPLNERYAAPELFEPGSSPSSDQYSLALIYAEMLTGVHPRRPHRSGPRAQAARSAKMDLDLLPATDREVLRRALHADPDKRFPSCTELVRALEGAGGGEAARQKAMYNSLPPIIPYASLFGEPPPPGTVLPSLKQLVAELLTAGAGKVEVHTHGNFRYLQQPGDVLEAQFPVRRWPGMMRLKVASLRQQWGAQVVEQHEDSCVLRLNLATSFFQRCAGRKPGLEVRVQLQPLPGLDGQTALASLRIQACGGGGELASEKLRAMGPLLIENVRSHLQAPPEQRRHERLPCSQPVRIFPVLPDMELGEVIEATARDVSLGGICVASAAPPASGQVYLHLGTIPRLAAYAILARVMWTRPLESGGHNLGASFASDGA